MNSPSLWLEVITSVCILYKSSQFDGLRVLLGIRTHVEEYEQNGSNGDNVVSGESG